MDAGYFTVPLVSTTDFGCRMNSHQAGTDIKAAVWHEKLNGADS